MAFRGFGKPTYYYLLWILPRNLISRICGYLSNLHLPVFCLQLIIKFFCRFYEVNLYESEKNISEFHTFNEFFTRRLKREARPVDQSKNSLISPVDGFIGEYGTIKNGILIQAKGMDYRLQDLIQDKNRTTVYDGGEFITIYLAPHNYHRIHSITDGEVNEFSYITGDLWTVSSLGINYITNLFARNERLTTYINTKNGECAIVKVGATVVGKIRVNYHSQVSNLSRKISKKITLDDPYRLEKGQEIGLFELGSTVICLFPPKQIELYDLKIGQVVKFGSAIGKFN